MARDYEYITDEELVQSMEMLDELEHIFGESVVTEEFKLELFHEARRREEMIQSEVEE